MKHFLLRLFAVIGVVAVIGSLISGTITWLWFKDLTEPPQAPKEMVLSLDLTQPISELPTDFNFSLRKVLYGEETSLSLVYLVRALERAKDDPAVKGVIVRVGAQAPSLAQAQEIDDAIRRFRESGKFSYAYADNYGSFGSGASAFLSASGIENRWLQPVGVVGIKNIGIEAPFAKTALGKIGVQADFIRRKEYKSAMETVTNDAFSAPVKENMLAMLGDLNDQVARRLAANLKIDEPQAKTLLSGGPYTTAESLKAGLVTKLDYMDSFFDEIDSKAGKSAKIVDPATYLYYLGIQQNEAPKSKIALIIADGSLVESKPKGPSRLAQDNVIDTDQMAQAFEDAAKDDDVKAILFRVNSPGGAPSASETIRHALVKAKEKNKPVYVSMGSVAASGGYWISMDGDKIFADPATLTGSIGVLGGKFVLGGLFDKLGITWEALSTGGDNADIFSLSKPFSPKGRERMNAMIDETYRTFTAYVAKARRLSPEKTEEVAKGRIFTGAQAVQVGLVDQLGGINDALNALKEKIGLKPEDILTVSLYPQPETPMSLALKMLEDLHFGGAMVRQYLPFLNSFTGVQGPQARLPYPYRVAE